MKTEEKKTNRGRVITVPVKLDEKTFKRFARYDAFALRRRWVRPAVFSALMIFFSALALLSRQAQSGLIAATLLAVGLGLPVVYVGSFISQVNVQSLRNRLNPARKVYTVTLDEDGLSVVNHQVAEDPLRVAWPETYLAVRRKDCVYLYVSQSRAFLLPAGQASVSDEELWRFLLEHMGPQKCRSHRP